MGGLSWPSDAELDGIRKMVAEISGRGIEEVRVVVSPYRICPLGAHIDHQGGTVSAMTINRGILLGFVPSGDSQVLLRSGQFKGDVRFRVDEIQLPKHTVKSNHLPKLQEEYNWGIYARGAIYALQSRGNHLTQILMTFLEKLTIYGASAVFRHRHCVEQAAPQKLYMRRQLHMGIIGFVCGSEGLDSSGLSSSAAVGIAYLLAFESANNLTVSPSENIEYDRLIENEYLGLKNGILDQSAILLSRYDCLTFMNCKTKEHKIIHPQKLQKNLTYKILLACSGLKQALTNNPGYNHRVAECQEAASVLLQVSGRGGVEPFLSNVELEVYEAYKCELEPNLARRAEHYFSENLRVLRGLEAWASGELDVFGKLISASGLSSIQNYECGCEPLIQLYEILLKAPGVYGARFSGAGFRGCCVAFVDADCATEAASFVKNEYCKLQPKLASQIKPENAVLICDADDCARVI